MGGYGSSRWTNYQKKRTVEECNTLSVSDFSIPGVGRITWRDGFSCRYLVSFRRDPQWSPLKTPILHISYCFQRRSIKLRVPFQSTRLHAGGLRWWFLCPACGRRVGKLHRPSDGQDFRCRHCLSLSYRSRQEYDKRVAFYRKHPESIKAELARATLTGEVLSPLKILLMVKAIDGGVT